MKKTKICKWVSVGTFRSVPVVFRIHDLFFGWLPCCFATRLFHVPNTTYLGFHGVVFCANQKNNGNVNFVYRRNCTRLFHFKIIVWKLNQNTATLRAGKRKIHPTISCSYGVAATQRKGPAIFWSSRYCSFILAILSYIEF